MTFGTDHAQGGDKSTEAIIKLIEEINSNGHYEFEIETYLDKFKKFEKFLQ